MAWGGGPVTGFGGPGAITAARNAGLPFAGVPGPLQERVEEVLDGEPEHPEPEIEFRQPMPEGPPFSLRSFLAGHRRGLALAFALVVIETVMLQTGPLLTQVGIDNGVVPGDVGVLVTVAMVYVATIGVHALASYARIAFAGRLGERLMYELRLRIFSHLQRLSLNYYTDEKAGVVMTRMTSDIEALQMLFQEGLVNLAVQALTLVVISGILFWLNPLLAVLTLVLVIPATFLLSIWFRNVSDTAYARVRDRIADVLSDLQESLAGIRIVTAHNRRRHNVVHHTNVVGAHKDANLAAARAASTYAPATEAIGVIGQALLLLIGGFMVFNGNLTIGELTAFVLYLTAFFAPIQQLVLLYTAYQQGQASIAKLRELLSVEPSVPEAADAAVLPPLQGDIAFEGVSFSYDHGPEVLHDIDLHVPAGSSLAVVGPTGAGKSTIAKLVSRFYDPDAGRVLLDGHDIAEVTLHSLRRQLGVVPQEPFLFHGSVRDNVGFADPDATDSDVQQACRAVGLDELIAQLPDGVDTPVHERGASLSAGERQLLALARAFLAKPRVLVLDEATSNLDLRSETKIEQALDALLDGRTAILIAHRLATAMRADRIAVVDEGRIVELGTHDALVANGGRYAEMYATWMAHQE